MSSLSEKACSSGIEAGIVTQPHFGVDIGVGSSWLHGNFIVLGSIVSVMFPWQSFARRFSHSSNKDIL